jgi:hypothetical protein
MEENLGANSTPSTAESSSQQPVAPQTTQTPEPTLAEGQQPKTPAPTLLTQEEVNKIVAGRIREVTKKLHDKYGVNTDAELNSIIDKGRVHDEMQGQLQKLNEEISALKSEKLLRLSKVRGDKMQDVLDLLKGKNLSLTEANIKEVLKQHPEWVRKRKPKVVAPIGVAQPAQKPQDDMSIARSFFKSLNR